MSTLKTQENDASVDDFLQTIDNPEELADAIAVQKLMEEVTGCKAKMWGKSIVGFGRYHYTNTGKGGSWHVVGFSPRKTALTLYIMSGFSQFDELMSQLGKYKTGKSCLYIKKLADVDINILRQLIIASIDYMKSTYQCEFN